MKKNETPQRAIVSGIGVTSAIGQGKKNFLSALLNGTTSFAVMQREGRQFGCDNTAESHPGSAFLGAEIAQLEIPDNIPHRLLRSMSFSAKVALATLNEAWYEAQLEHMDPQRIGLIVGGSNIQQRELTLCQDKYRGRETFIRPSYAMSFMDTDLCGLCTEQFDIKGFAHTHGGASASGQLAVIQAIEAVLSGQVDVCIALGALMDISYWECQAFRTMGAMGSNRFAAEPARACRPFDKLSDGFIYGESCAALVIERENMPGREAIEPYAMFKGWALSLDGNRNPNSSAAGERQVISEALTRAGVKAAEMDYINPHGTGSNLGDKNELAAIGACNLSGAKINTTKSIIGHGLSAAGAVEMAAALLQMREQVLHPCGNLESPVDPCFNWVLSDAEAHHIRNALCLSYGFGGLNSAVCLQRV